MRLRLNFLKQVPEFFSVLPDSMSANDQKRTLIMLENFPKYADSDTASSSKT